MDLDTHRCDTTGMIACPDNSNGRCLDEEDAIFDPITFNETSVIPFDPMVNVPSTYLDSVAEINGSNRDLDIAVNADVCYC